MPGNYIIGREEQVYIAEQSAWGTPVWPIATNAIKHLKCTIERKEDRKPRADQNNTRSRGTTIVGKRSATWKLSGLLIPSGTAGTAPDARLLFKHWFGLETVNAGVSVVYSIVKDLETVLNGLTIHRFANHMHQAVQDAVVNDLMIKASGTGEAEWEASGDGTEEILTGSSTLASTALNLSTTATLATGDGPKFSVNSKVDIGTSTGHIISAIAGDVITFSPGLSGSQASGLAVIPNKPSATTNGVPISGIVGAYSFGGSTIKAISSQVKLANKLKMRNNEYGNALATGFASPDQREVSFDKELYLTKDYLKYYGHARNLVQNAIVLTIGSAAGKQAVISMGKTELNIPPIEIPDKDEAVLKAAGYALPTSGDDEVTLTFQ